MSHCSPWCSFLFLLTHFCRAIIGLILCSQIPELIDFCVFKLLDFTQLSVASTYNYAGCFYRWMPMWFLPPYFYAIAFQFITCADHDQRHFKMSSAAVQTKTPDASASCSLVEVDKHKPASFFFCLFILFFYIFQLSSLLWSLALKRLIAICSKVFQTVLCMFSCLRTWHTH